MLPAYFTQEAVTNNEYSEVYKKFIRCHVKKFLAFVFFSFISEA